MTFPVGSPRTQPTVGKAKQTHAEEMVGDAANLAAQKHFPSPLFVSRAVGARIMRVIDDRLPTFAFRADDDGWAGSGSTGPDAGTDMTGRATRPRDSSTRTGT